MFFRNCTYFKIRSDAEAVAEKLKSSMAAHAFTPCGSQQASSLGFVAPWGDSLYVEQPRVVFFMLKHQVKKISGPALKERLAAKVEAIEEEQQRKVYRKERLQMKDELVQDLLPTTMPASKYIGAYIDTKGGWIAIDTAAPTQAEMVMTAVRHVVGSLPALIPVTNNSPSLIMTLWLRDRPEGPFAIDGSCKLEEPGVDGTTVTIKNGDLYSESVGQMLDEGKAVQSIRVLWDDSIGLTISDAHILKGLRFADQLQDDSDDETTRNDADLVIMSTLIRTLIDDIGNQLGGWHE